MKTKFKNNHTIKAVLGLLIVGAVATSCKKDFFDIKSRNSIDSDIWNSQGAIQFFLNDTYDVIMPKFPHDFPANDYLYAADDDKKSADDAISKKLLGISGIVDRNDIKFIATKYQGTFGDNKYFDIARCNNAIKFLPTSNLSKDLVDKFRGQFYTLRAMAYFDLVRIYGGVPLVLEPQDPQNSAGILIPRAKAEEIFKAIVQDLDSAKALLPTVWTDGSGKGKITSQAAYALKANALMYWASPQFNPNDGIHAYDPTRWDKAYDAAKEAYTKCFDNGSKLLDEYGAIFTTEGTANTEALIVRSYSGGTEKGGHDIEFNSRPASEGGAGAKYNAPTWNLVKAYTMDDGTPIAKSATYDQNIFWVNRDPRFYASIAYNGATWGLSGNASRKQWNYDGAESPITGTGFYFKRFCNNSISFANVKYQDDFGGSGMDWIELRYAEVILIRAECANETGKLQEAKDMVKELRIRAKVKQGSNNYGLDLATTPAEMAELIANEREVEFALEGKRFFDLRRTRKYLDLTGTMDKIVWKVKDNNAKTYLEALNPTTGLKNRESLNLNDKAVFNQYFTLTVSTVNNSPFNPLDNVYFLPLPNTFMDSSPTLVQTIGHNGGTFDPLKLK